MTDNIIVQSCLLLLHRQTQSFIMTSLSCYDLLSTSRRVWHNSYIDRDRDISQVGLDDLGGTNQNLMIQTLTMGKVTTLFVKILKNWKYFGFSLVLLTWLWRPERIFSFQYRVVFTEVICTQNPPWDISMFKIGNHIS